MGRKWAEDLGRRRGEEVRLIFDPHKRGNTELIRGTLHVLHLESLWNSAVSLENHSTRPGSKRVKLGKNYCLQSHLNLSLSGCHPLPWSLTWGPGTSDLHPNSLWGTRWLVIAMSPPSPWIAASQMAALLVMVASLCLDLNPKHQKSN
jgi:hypothetical protein